jgi:hypothetical protein
MGSIQNGMGQARRFRAEDEAVSGLEPEAENGRLGARREKNAPTGSPLTEKALQIAMNPQDNRRPVIQARSLEVSVRQPKPEGLDEVERGLGCRARSGDVACILGDFGLVEDHLER